jgi:hypothetical protein
VLVQPDGGILIGGSSAIDYGTYPSMFLMRLNPYGGGDPTFGAFYSLLGAHQYVIPGSPGPVNEVAGMAFYPGEKLVLMGPTGEGDGNYPNYTGVIRIVGDLLFANSFDSSQ